MLTNIVFTFSPIAFSIGNLEIRWYGLLFALGLFMAGWYVWVQFRRNGIPQRVFEELFIYVFIGIFVGARIGHCLFYEPIYYFNNPHEILLPISIYSDGDWEFTGYHGLASHGAGIGLIITLLIYGWKRLASK